MKPKMDLIQIAEKIKRCQKCGLYKNRRQAVPGHFGNKTRHLVFIGEAPGFEEDVKGEPFVGASGKRLMAAIKEICHLEREDYTILNTVKCRPPDNRDPTSREKKLCRPFLMAQISNIGTCLIVTLGRHAAHSVLNTEDSMEILRSHFYVDKDNTILVVPTFHPAATMYNPKWRKLFEDDLGSLNHGEFTKHRTRAGCNIHIEEQESLEEDCDLL